MNEEIKRKCREVAEKLLASKSTCEQLLDKHVHDGQLDVVTVLNRAITPDEVKKIYESAEPKKPVSLEDIFKVVCDIRDILARQPMIFTPPKPSPEDEEKMTKVRESLDKMRSGGWTIVPAMTKFGINGDISAFQKALEYSMLGSTLGRALTIESGSSHFTDRARKSMQLANQEAQRWNHEYIGTEHILIGLAKEGSGVAAHVLQNLGADLGAIRLAVEQLLQAEPGLMTMGKLPRTPRAAAAIANAVQEAISLGHSYVGTEHLLLGLLHDKESIACQALVKAVLTLDQVREEILNIIGLPKK